MGTLRTSLIRLAHQNPSLRPHLLPILKTARNSFEFLLSVGVNHDMADAVRMDRGGEFTERPTRSPSKKFLIRWWEYWTSST